MIAEYAIGLMLLAFVGGFIVGDLGQKTKLRITRLRLRPGDVLVVQSELNLTQSMVNHLADQFADLLGDDNKVLICPPAISPTAVIRRERAAA